MKQLLLCMILLPAGLWANEPIETEWNRLCQNAGPHRMSVTTADGATQDGYCVSVSVDAVSIRTDGPYHVIKIARNRITAMQLHTADGHQLEQLGRRTQGGFRWGFKALFSPDAIAGLVVIPVNAAVAVISAPFCILGDIGADIAGTREIHLK